MSILPPRTVKHTGNAPTGLNMSPSGNVSSYEKPYFTSSLYGGRGGGVSHCTELDMIRSNVYKWTCSSHLTSFIKICTCIKIYGEPHNHILEPF